MPVSPADQALHVATAQYRAGQLGPAETSCRGILAGHPEHIAALVLLGAITADTQRHDEAISLLTRVTLLAPRTARYHSDLGVVYRRAGRLDKAAECLEHAASLAPDSALVRLNLGDVLHALGRIDEAIAQWRHTLALAPDCAEAHNNLGNAFSDRGQWTDAIACYRRAIGLKPGYAEGWNNLAAAQLGAEQLDDALASCRRALALRPGFAEAFTNLGLVLVQQGEFVLATLAFRRAVALRPDFAPAHWNLALLLLLQGHYEEGWREHEWRWFAPELKTPRRNFAEPEWKGGLARGETILVHTEQGAGDLLHFVRYLPLVRERTKAANVIMECPPVLSRLIEQSGGWNGTIVSRSPGDVNTPLPRFDRHVALLSLPLALGVFAPLETSRPYLHADEKQRDVWREKLGPASQLRVGLAWAGNAIHRRNRWRSIAPEKLLPILQVPDARFYSLQVVPDRSAPATLLDAGLIDHTRLITDFADTAALVAEMDLVVTVDTAVAHIAGALGKRVWTLVPFVPDWRWGLDREDTPWYATMRLFRQRAAGDWDDVIARVAAELACEVKRSSSTP